MFDAHFTVKEFGLYAWWKRTLIVAKTRWWQLKHWFGIPTWAQLKDGRICRACGVIESEDTPDDR